MPARNDYITVISQGTKKVSVAARRVGTRDRHSVIAVANDEGTAEKIVDALNHLQGEVKNIEVPVQRTLDEVRRSLSTANDRLSELAREKRQWENDKRDLSRKIDVLTQERNLLQVQVAPLRERNETQAQTISEQIEQIRALEAKAKEQA